jgi:hypothetical protein
VSSVPRMKGREIGDERIGNPSYGRLGLSRKPCGEPAA